MSESQAMLNIMDSQILLDLTKVDHIIGAYRSVYERRSIPAFYRFDKQKNNAENLFILSSFFLYESITAPIALAYSDILLELTARAITNEEVENYCISQFELKPRQIPGSLVLSAVAKAHSPDLGSLVEFFLAEKNFFQKLDTEIANEELQEILLAFYRLLRTDRQRYHRFVQPSVLYSCMNSESSSSVNKYLSIQILYQYLSLSEAARNTMLKNYLGNQSLKSHYEGDRDVDLSYLNLLEAKRLANITTVKNTTYDEHKCTEWVNIKPEDLSRGVAIVGEILVPDLPTLANPHREALFTTSQFVPIAKSSRALREIAQCIKTCTPVMLVGASGSGKTFLVNEAASLMKLKSDDVIKIHLNQQTDSKLLLGTYSSGSQPGSFEWKSGILTTAVREGKWVFVEDIDKAPTEVLSVLLGLLEKRELLIPSRGEVIRAANGFQLLATLSIREDNDSVPDLIGSRMWKTVYTEQLDTSDLSQILLAKFPVLRNLLPVFLKCFFDVEHFYTSKKFLAMNRGSQPRNISTRDLMKFCKRCERSFQKFGLVSSDDLMQQELYDTLFQEAVDCFSSSIADQTALEALIKQIGESLEIPTSRINLHVNKHVPTFNNSDDHLSIGRAILSKAVGFASIKKNSKSSGSFARTNHSLRLMEKVGVSISMVEPVLLVGETGTGKTTVVQQVASLLGKKLVVINVSQQTEVSDLLGGFKPVTAKTIALPVQEVFEELFNRTFSAKKNAQFLQLLSKCFNKSQWKAVGRLWKEACKMADSHLTKPEKEDSEEGEARKKRKLNDNDKERLHKEWSSFKSQVSDFEKEMVNVENSFVFRFVEGSLVKAVRNGDWLLLDEINLAAPETLESISDLLSEDIQQRNVLLSEKGDIEKVLAHQEFRIFGCMNPATDVGKKELPSGIRSKFSEVYVSSPGDDISDLLMIIDKYIGAYVLADEWCGNDIAELYIAAKKMSDENRIVDSSNQRPHFSIRTLTRTLTYVRDIISIYGLRRSLFEAFCMSFLTLLDASSEQILKPLIEKYTIQRLKNAKSVLSQIPPDPSSHDAEFVQFKYYWMRRGPLTPQPQAHYIITPFVEKNLLNLVRASSSRRFPVLIQGPTSSGKTSMIHYLAKITGHKFVRINNHEHTDLQEYLGTYVSDDTGKLVFKEGILVDALRNGHWIVLDELNLAPTDVLEALNRLLDDNRELFIPETQEIIRPHPHFMLFATQNPPGLYGGRKVLSKAFRNRFLELHFDDIPQDELEVILRERCQIAPTYAKKIVAVYKELTVQRQSTRLFEEKNSFATLRDLFRWATREAVGYEQLAANGYMLLAERVRKPDEKAVVQKAVEKIMKVKLDMDAYYSQLEDPKVLSVDSNVIWTKAMRRLAVLVKTAMEYNEPILLVGETGCGKTTICQLLADISGKELISVNAHQNMETGDLLGAQRPIRNRTDILRDLISLLKTLLAKIDLTDLEENSLDELLKLFDQNSSSFSDEERTKVQEKKVQTKALFQWSDGPLIQALKTGSFFLLDEISLADDSVLERLNSVLEPERTILLAEKGSDEDSIVAREEFKFFATMNPGGDYGKKELSPALRNRFTEIWVPSMEDFDDVRQIVQASLVEGSRNLTNALVDFSKWFAMEFGGGSTSNGVISLRDILAWVRFINSTQDSAQIPPAASLLHGACMVFIDALGTNNTAYLSENEEHLRKLKLKCVHKLSEFAGEDLSVFYGDQPSVTIEEGRLTSGFYSFPTKGDIEGIDSFNLQAPTTAGNAMRVLRAMQVRKPILLEGSPGVGKTSLISALAKATGNPLTRINLSEQTDLIDLFGSDVPAEGGAEGEFVWRDAPFLRAMQRGEWVLLDEMNLASQSVLEGLNACLDHRGEAYIPELDRSFVSHPEFMVFAAQNPQYQGGGRKGLPKSFVNRFSVVYIDMLTGLDLEMIASHLYPNIDTQLCQQMISFVSKLEKQVVIDKAWGASGGPWEFNLRDTLRWLSLMSASSLNPVSSPSDFFQSLIVQRFRSVEDQEHASALFKEIFVELPSRDPYLKVGQNFVQANSELVERSPFIQYTPARNLQPLQCNFDFLETLFRTTKNAWPLILVGPSGSGKSDLIKYAAGLVGAQLIDFPMNNEIDSMDLLGGYEQSDMSREVSDLSRELFRVTREIIAENLCSEESEFNSMLALLQELDGLSHVNGDTTFWELDTTYNKIKEIASSNESLKALDKSFKTLKAKASNGNSALRFQWFDGTLLNAVEKGQWLVLDNANLCNASVLDRLNSLLETNGSLLINECDSDNGSVRIVKPHPNFRLFLTMDPKYGELSRAMRNRGVEMYMDTLDVRATEHDRKILGLSEVSQKESDIIIDMARLHPFSSEVCLPAGYLNGFDSRDVSYSSLLDLSTTPSCQPEIIASIVSFGQISQLGGFAELNSSSAEFSSVNIAFMQAILDPIETLQQNDLAQPFFQLYSDALNKSETLKKDAETILYQSLNPLVNSYLVPLISELAPAITSSEPLYFYTLISRLSKNRRDLERHDSRSKVVKLSELTFIESSAAVANGRALKNIPKLNVFRLTMSLLEFLAEQVNLSTREGSFFQSKGLYELLFRAQIILSVIIDSSHVKDESKLRVLQVEVSKWLKELEMALPGSSDVIDRFSKELSKFSEPLKLTRGFSVQRIWESFRGAYPSSDLGWYYQEKIAVLSAEFDLISQKQFKETFEMVGDLKVMLLEISKASIHRQSDDIDELLEKIAKGIDALNKVSEGFLTAKVHPYKEEFSMIMNFIETYCCKNRSSISTSPKLLELAHQAGRPTLSLTSFTNSVPFKPYPRFFENLWNFKQDDAGVCGLFGNEFMSRLVLSSKDLALVEGRNLDQVLSDLKDLSSAVIFNSGSILVDQVEQFKSILIQWMSSVLLIHSEVFAYAEGMVFHQLVSRLEDPTTIFHATKELGALFQLCPDKNLYNTFFDFIQPALLEIAQADDVRKLGRSWVLFSSALLQLFVPSSSYDPAVSDHMARQLFETEQLSIKSMFESWITAKRSFSGDKSTLLESCLPIEKEGFNDELEVFRPHGSADALFEEWNAFMDSTAGMIPVEKLLKGVDEFSTNIAKELEIFQKNSSRFILRLQTNFGKYADMNDIIAGYVYGMKLGFSLMTSFANSTSYVKDLWTINLKNFFDNEYTMHYIDSTMAVAKACAVEDASAEKFFLHLMKLYSFHKAQGTLSDDLEVAYKQSLTALYYRWTLRRLKEEEKQSIHQGIYKYDDPTVDAEKDFMKMFPDYEDVLDIDTEDTTKDSSLETLFFSIANVYVQTFTESDEYSLQEIVSSGTDLYAELHGSDLLRDTVSSSATLIVPVMDQMFASLNKFQTDSSSEGLDFYHGFSIAETKRAGSIVRKLETAVDRLLKQWPEHATLQNLLRVTREFLTYPVKTPLQRLLQKIEQIYTFIAEWEKYAHSGVSLKEQFEELAQLIISWRRLELSCWKTIFANEDKAVEFNLGAWWFHLFENIIAPALAEERLDQEQSLKFLSAINVFLSQTTYGEFRHRLKLVKAFAAHLNLLGKSILHDSLRNVISFYEQFLPSVKEYEAAGKKKLERDINEVILLASWKDVNVDALKQSARRSHQSLFKIVRKYRTLLNEQLKPLIESGIAFEAKVPSFAFQVNLTNYVEVNVNYSLCEKVESWKERPARLQRSGVVEKNMTHYVDRIAQEFLPTILEMAWDLLSETERLRKETPTVATEDNKKECSALKIQKSRLFSDTIKELRRIGLKLHTTTDIQSALSSVNNVFVSAKALDDKHIEGCDVYFFRMLDLLPRLKAVANNPAQDAPVSDVQKGLVASENLLVSLIATRSTLQTLANNHLGLINLVNEYNTLYSKDEHASLIPVSVHNSMAQKASSLQNYQSLLQKTLEYLIGLVGSCARYASIKVDSSVFTSISARVARWPSSAFPENSEVFTVDQLDEIRSVTGDIENFKDELTQWIVQNAPVSFIGESLLVFLKSLNFDVFSSTSLTAVFNLSDLELSLRQVCISIMLAFQKIIALNEEEEIDEEMDQWLVKTGKRLTQYSKALRTKTIIAKLTKALKTMASIEHNESSSLVSKALMASALPFIRHYQNLVTTVLKKNAENYSETAYGTYLMSSVLFNVAKNGFCSPEEKQTEKQDDNLHDGTGLGDGEGANNVSNDVEDDEELDDYAQEKNKEKDDNEDGDENEDAVDMEGDMAGDLEDAPPEDEEGEENEDGEDDLDEEIDNIDDTDPNAIDEKMWDEESKESKEKESEQMPEDSNSNEDVQGNEDESKQEQENNDDADAQKDDDEVENDEDGEDEEDVGEQQDEVRNEEDEKLEENVDQSEALELPDDMNLDSDNDEDEKEGDAKDDFDDGMDVDEENTDLKEEPAEEENVKDENGEEEDQDNAEEAEGEDIISEGENAEDDEALDRDEEMDAGESNVVEEEQESEGELDDAKGEEADEKDEQDKDTLEGADGVEDEGADEAIDADAAAQQKSGKESEGAQADVQEESEDVGATGAATQQSEEEIKNENDGDNSRDQAKESLKQLGDAMKEFHRRHQEIKEAGEIDDMVDQKSGERPDEFQHLEGETAENQTQALGAADEDQIQHIDDEMAIDEEEEEKTIKNEPTVKEEAETEDVEMETADQDNGDGNTESEARAATVGDRERFAEVFETDGALKEEEDSESEYELIGNDNYAITENPTISLEEARDLWRQSEIASQDLAAGLSEQLRLILEPTLATKLRGDYKTGKRLNMKRIIPYIASQFRKDKIWLRRTKPSKRQYQIMIAVDDSKSMAESQVVKLAFDSITLVSKALTQLEAGALSIVKFGETAQVLHPFERPFSQDSGPKVFQWFDFQQTRTDIRNLVAKSLDIFAHARASGDSELWQLQIIISDGVCEDHATIQRLVRQAREEKIMLVFVVMDGINSNESIMDMSQVSYDPDSNGNMTLKVNKYLDTFPFEFYVVVHNIKELPEMLSLILRQYFTELAST
ncbi:unnamed protein product [Kuraishia capsulata CBS 1993]|uniref:Midasin n=1 Tax=Kuraishia capsulata CBS 1993 TaxID=1382522 RepID=W6MT66_9ASCO|nr:uncharacterized protein KUCA_T00005566001 [Kuraishia capsulata CBS 1993]CDK29573.1 unnamed protein product [Kuraishia capsulata CBS 1993]